MKSFISVLSLLFVLFFVSCSDMQQENSPIAPDFQKAGNDQLVLDGTYSYLQCFDFVPVYAIRTTKSPGTIDVVISPDKFPKYFMHMFVVLEYKNTTLPFTNKMIFVGKPKTNIIQLDNVEIKNLQSAKVYAYIPQVDWKGIQPPYNYLTIFDELVVDDWNVSDEEIVIYTDDWKANLSDTFVELTLSNQDQPSFVLTYISKPDNGKVTVPKFIKETIIKVKMYGFFNNNKID